MPNPLTAVYKYGAHGNIRFVAHLVPLVARCPSARPLENTSVYPKETQPASSKNLPNSNTASFTATL